MAKGDGKLPRVAFPVMKVFRNLARLALRAAGVGLGLLILIGIVLEVGIRTARLPAALEEGPPVTPRVLDSRGELLAIVPKGNARVSLPVPLSEMGRWLPEMTMAIEDHRFMDHSGVDVIALSGALLRNLRDFRIVGGASTISQQLIKLSSDRRDRSLKTKLSEALSAMKLERLWTKNQILEAYLNRLDYGNRRIGPAAAALAYFGKRPADLTPAEAIFLAGLPQSPTRWNPWNHPAAAEKRYRRNVARLEKMEALPMEAAPLLNAPPKILRIEAPRLASHYVNEVMRQTNVYLPEIRTSLDVQLQKTMERLLTLHMAKSELAGIRSSCVVVIENATGQIRAYAVSGGDVDAASTLRSCGSTLKPFLYLRALDEKRLTAASLLPDTPDAISKTYSDYDPKNFSRRYHGPVRVREALGNSLNVPAVLALSQTGARNVFDSLSQWGFSLPGGFDAYGAGFILGNAPVTAVELAAAYAGIARGGWAWTARFTPTESVEIHQAASPEACAIVADMLSDPTARIRSFGTASPLNLPQRTAVKTGTSSGFRDGWCVGFNGRHTVAVWAGNLDGQPMGELLAVRSAAPLWAAAMEYLYSCGDEPVPAPTDSEALAAFDVDPVTGLLPRPGGPTIREWFLAGTQPTESAAAWYDKSNRLLLPDEYTAWCQSPHNRLGARVRESGTLAILAPADNARFEWNPALSPKRQSLAAEANRKDCEWFLNGHPLPDNMVPLTKGRHQLQARQGDEMAEVSILVE